MRIAYLDCASGISGDMTLGALVDAGVPLSEIQLGIDSLGLPSCRLVATEVKKRGFRATQIIVEHEPEHAHRHLHHITAMIERSTLSLRQRELAASMFLHLAEAEAKVHGTTVEKVHFHEVGAVDSIADIVGAAIGWDLLGVERIIASPIPTGSGFVEIAHGRCPIPAPATAELLRGVPLASFDVAGELTTPTGAAIVRAMVDDFGPVPAMKIDAIGYGAGQKDFPQANLLRLLVGETVGTVGASAAVLAAGIGPSPGSSFTDSIVLLEANLDDAHGELVSFCAERLWEAGALDVATTSIQMKKGRPGILLAVQAPPEKADRLADLIFRHTPTLGIRRNTLQRIVLAREECHVATKWGNVSGKLATLPDGSRRFSPEYEPCQRIALELGLPLEEVYYGVRQAFADGKLTDAEGGQHSRGGEHGD